VTESTEELKRLIERYRKLVTDSAAGDALRAATEALLEIDEEADLAYLLENVPTALTRSRVGLAPMSSIVSAMKEFVRCNAEPAPLDINHALSNTLIIAGAEYLDVAEVTTDFGEVPPITSAQAR